MSYIALYRKYRPQNFSEVVGQEIIVNILKNSLIAKKINHAYIFSGPKGTGKTSIAKIYGKAVNCLAPVEGDLCGKCSICKSFNEENIDIIEIDAASNNGVDEIREIRNNVSIMPVYSKYKVYIIDEVHMLSSSAFNALLKTLEEPPEHVIFILATTELNKIPSTVLSRCQKLDFKKISPNKIEKQINYILKKEKRILSNKVITLISELSDGSFRDAINLLDQLLTYNKKNITIEDVYNLIGSPSEEIIDELIESICNNNVKKGLTIINKIYNEGKNFGTVCNQLQKKITDIIINNNTHEYFDLCVEKKLLKYSDLDNIKLLNLSDIMFELNNSIKKTVNQKNLLETYFIKMCLLFKKDKEQTKEMEENIEQNNIEIEENEKKKENSKHLYDKELRINNTFALADKEIKKDFLKKFKKIKDYVSDSEYSSVVNLLLKSTPEVVSEKNILFVFKKTFEVILFDKNIELIQKLFKEIYKIKFDLVSIEISEWEKEREKYILNIKEGKKYIYMEETKKNNKKGTLLESEAENIFGENILTVE